MANSNFASDSDTSTASSASPTPPPAKRAKAPRITVTIRDGKAVFKTADRRLRLGGSFRERRAKEKGPLGANFEARGETMMVRGKMYFRDKNFEEWTRGEYHEKYRGQFIEEDARKGTWVYVPSSGRARLDRTSFVRAQKNWGCSPKLLLNIVDKNGRKIYEQSQRPNDVPGEEDKHDWWVHDGAVLLDQDNHPLHDIPGLNRTFTTALEGWRIDALRKLFPNLMLTDIRGRMPHKRVDDRKERPLQGLEAFANRAWRWRKQNNIADWNIRGGSAQQRRERGIRCQERNRRPKEVQEPGADGGEPEEEEGSEAEGLIVPTTVPERTREAGSGQAAIPFSAGRLTRHVFGDDFRDKLGEDNRRYFSPSTNSMAGENVDECHRQLPDAPQPPQGMRTLVRAQLTPNARIIYDREVQREAARLGVTPASISLVPLFALPGDQHQALLQGRDLTSPWAVMQAYTTTPGLVNDVHLVMRAHNAPRASDPTTGQVMNDVAVLTQAMTINLSRIRDQGYDIDWFDEDWTPEDDEEAMEVMEQ